jgi:signal peptidase I
MSRTRTADRPKARLRRWAVNVTLAAVILAFGAAAAAVLSGNYQVRPVLSASMTPGLPVGGVVVTQRVPTSTLKVRDVIVFAKPGGAGDLIVHRIIALKRTSGQLQVRTQGDANPAADPWTASLRGTTAYRAVGSLPFLGYAAVWAHGPSGRQAALLGAGLLGLLACAATLRSGRRRAGSGPDIAPDGRERATA